MSNKDTSQLELTPNGVERLLCNNAEKINDIRETEIDVETIEKAILLFHKLEYALRVCNLKGVNRKKCTINYLNQLVEIIFHSSRLTEDAIKAFIQRMDKLATRLLKNKPPFNSWFLTMTHLDIGYTLEESEKGKKESNRETTT